MSGSKTTQTNKALPQYGNAYSQLLTQAQQTGSQPFTPYTGNLVAGFNPTQTGVFGQVANTVGATGSATADPYLAAAQGYFGNATTPLWEGVQHFSPSAVGQYESPYTTDVVNATQNQFNLQNAQEEAKLKGNVAAAGAFGGDRQAVLESELAGQEQAAQAPVIANLENQGFQTALGEFNTQQQNQLGADEANAWLNSQAAFGEASLGSEAQNLALTGESALGNVGQEQQALAQQQLNVPYEQWQQQAFPYQQESWLSGIETGLGGAAGSTSTSKNSQSLGASILGGLESLTGLAGITGAFPSTSGTGAAATTTPGWLFRRGGAVHRAPGGPIPNLDESFIPSGITTPHMQPAKANAQPPQPQHSGGGSGIANVLPFLMAARRGGGLPHRADGGDLGTPANDDVNPPTAQAATGTDGMPFPNVDYQPQPIPNTWAQDARMAPWEALLEAGGETLASGNVGRGITAGVQSYAQARKAAQEAETKGMQAQNEGLYRQADVREAADKLWQEAQDAKARIKHEDAQLAQTQAFHEAEQGNWQQERDLERQRIGVEEGNAAREAGKHTWTAGQQDGVSGAYDEQGVFHPGMDLTTRAPTARPTAPTANEALVQARKDYDHWMALDKQNGGDGTVYNKDGSVADPAAWVTNRAGQYLNRNRAAAASGHPSAAAPQPPAGFKRAPDGNYYAPDPNRPGKFVKWTP